jgi:hypothetical protein
MTAPITALSGPVNRPLYDSTDSLLRFALRVDATLTGLVGLAVALVADQDYLLGALFALYGLGVFTLAALPDVRRVGIGVIAANIAFTVTAVVAAGAVPMNAAGIAAMLASGVYTAFFAWLQYLGVRRLPRTA